MMARDVFVNYQHKKPLTDLLGHVTGELHGKWWPPF
jgi:hypothetical protein